MELSLKAMLLLALAAVSLAHLVSQFFKNRAVEAASKVCLVPLILAVYLCGANRVFFPVVLALVFGWIGDIMLLKIDNLRFFRFGLASFLLGHICYIPSMLYFAVPLNRVVLAASVCAAVPLGVAIRKLVRPSREMSVPAAAYETVILLMAAAAVQFFLARGVPSGAWVLVGGGCFLASDTMLAFFTFRAKPKYGDFFVMLTYIAAQVCIVLGLSAV